MILKQGEQGTPVAEVCRKAGISQVSYFNWKKKYGGLLPDEMRRVNKAITNCSFGRAIKTEPLENEGIGIRPTAEVTSGGKAAARTPRDLWPYANGTRIGPA